MNREELIMVKTYKCKELKKKLKPITDWKDVYENQLMFHEDDNNIYNENCFGSYDKENNIVEYGTITGWYTRSANGWYYYDETIADEVEEHYTPKLYIVKDIQYREDYWFVVAFDEKHLKENFIKNNRMENMTDEEFSDKYECEQLKCIDGFDVILK